MRKALVVIKEFSGRSIGNIERHGEAKAMTEQHAQNLLRGNCIAIDVPDAITSDHLKAVLKLAEAEKWTKDGEVDVTVNPQDETWSRVPATVEHYEIEEDSVKIKDLADEIAATAAKTAKKQAAKDSIKSKRADVSTMTLVQLKAIVADLLDLIED